MYENNKKGLRSLDEFFGDETGEKTKMDETIKEFLKNKKAGSFIKATDIGNDAQVEIQGSGIAIMALSLTICKHVLELIGGNDAGLAKAYISALVDLVAKYLSEHIEEMGGDDE